MSGGRRQFPGRACRVLAPDVRRRAGAVALRDDIARVTLAASALRGHTQLELDLVEAQSRLGVAGDVAVGDASADTNNHGNTGRVAVTNVGRF